MVHIHCLYWCDGQPDIRSAVDPRPEIDGSVAAQTLNAELCRYFTEVIPLTAKSYPDHLQPPTHDGKWSFNKTDPVETQHPCTRTLDDLGHICSDMDLAQLVGCTQTHAPCEKNLYASCRNPSGKHKNDHCHASTGPCMCGFPAQISETMKIGNHYKHPSAPMLILPRGPEDVYTNGYNPLVLQLWRANIDLQPILSMSALTIYLTNYICKGDHERTSYNAVMTALFTKHDTLSATLAEQENNYPAQRAFKQFYNSILKDQPWNQQMASLILRNKRLVHNPSVTRSLHIFEGKFHTTAMQVDTFVFDGECQQIRQTLETKLLRAYEHVLQTIDCPSKLTLRTYMNNYRGSLQMSDLSARKEQLVIDIHPHCTVLAKNTDHFSKNYDTDYSTSTTYGLPLEQSIEAHMEREKNEADLDIKMITMEDSVHPDTVLVRASDNSGISQEITYGNIPEGFHLDSTWLYQTAILDIPWPVLRDELTKNIGAEWETQPLEHDIIWLKLVQQHCSSQLYNAIRQECDIQKLIQESKQLRQLAKQQRHEELKEAATKQKVDILSVEADDNYLETFGLAPSIDPMTLEYYAKKEGKMRYAPLEQYSNNDQDEWMKFSSENMREWNLEDEDLTYTLEEQKALMQQLNDIGRAETFTKNGNARLQMDQEWYKTHQDACERTYNFIKQTAKNLGQGIQDETRTDNELRAGEFIILL